MEACVVSECSQSPDACRNADYEGEKEAQIEEWRNTNYWF